MRRFTQPISKRLADRDAEEVRQNHDVILREIQALPIVGAVVVKDVVLPDGVAVEVAHPLGREPLWVGPSAIRGAASAGAIGETRDGVNRKRTVKLVASGNGATITIDVLLL